MPNSMFLFILSFLFGIGGLSGASNLNDNDNEWINGFIKLTSEMKRLDAAALSVRKNRIKNWDKILSDLKGELKEAKNLDETLLVFEKLDASYPNLHSYVTFADAIKRKDIKVPVAGISRLWRGEKDVIFQITSISEDPKIKGDIKAGDELIAINGRSMDKWSEENFEFCKWPLREQCDDDLFKNLVNNYLSWKNSDPLYYTLKRGGNTWDIQIPLKNPQKRNRKKYPTCEEENSRYPGYSLTYAGARLCLYNNLTAPPIMRVMRFKYTKEDKDITSVNEEIERVKDYWMKNATWDHLIIDVAGNGGGSDPIAYYKLFFKEPFQEQWAQFKKGEEIEDETLRKSIFWNSTAHEISFQNLIKSGGYEKLKAGEFLPKVPMFCADDSKSCSEGKFIPFEHSFDGKISLIVDQYCVSSCDGFVYELKDSLKDKVRIVGQPQSADTAFSRLDLALYMTQENTLEVKVEPISAPFSENTILKQTVVVTRSVTEDGRVVDGVPEKVDIFIPDTNSGRWIHEAVSKAINTRWKAINHLH